ncbi:MAG: hypothetical protein IT490_09760 [Candidatus Contendobacter sp.]|nr:hypothetical protein [Candidatus Contendobacter sp.]
MGKQGLGKFLTALTGMALLGAALPAVAGQWVVIAAGQTSLQLGAVLDGGKPLKLAEGAQLTLLAEDGKTLKLSGPYSGAPENGGVTTDAPTDNLTTIAGLLQGHQQSASTLGVMRGNGAQQLPTAGLINVDQSGERCLSGDPVILWRGHAANAEQVTLTDGQGAALAHLTWPARQTELPVPGHYFEDGKSYLLQRPGKSVSLRVHKTAMLPDNPAARAAWMAKNGCKAQALIVLGGL